MTRDPVTDLEADLLQIAGLGVKVDQRDRGPSGSFPCVGVKRKEQRVPAGSRSHLPLRE